MPDVTAIDTAVDTTAVAPSYPRITADYYITKSTNAVAPGNTVGSTTTYVNVIVTLTEIEIGDFSTVWDNIKSNITANITAMTT